MTTGHELPHPSPFLPSRSDPRWVFAGLLTLYATLGCTVLGFNRSPVQIILTIAVTCLFDVILHRVLKRAWLFPLSAYITGLGLSLLVNYPHDLWLLLFPAFTAIASKHLLTFDGRHVLNPNLCGVICSLLLGEGWFSSAPSYQWGPDTAIVGLIIGGALLGFIRKVGRLPLVISFLVAHATFTLLRAWFWRWHLPWETIIGGTLASPATFLFAFYMITDPRTSPETRRGQIAWGVGCAALEFLWHLRGSLATLFYALGCLGFGKLIYLHINALRKHGFPRLLPRLRAWLAPLALCAAVIATALPAYQLLIRPATAREALFTFSPIPPAESGLDCRLGTLLDEVDPRARHIAKWLLSIGDAAAVADVDNDGLMDLFLTRPMKRPEDRLALYRNLGNFRFERVPLPALATLAQHPETHGLGVNALFGDYDNDGRPDLFIGVAWGRSLLLRNTTENGRISFIPAETGAILEPSTCLTATWADFDRDGLLDLFVGNSLTTELPDYQPPRPWSLFKLPAAEHPGDRRPFHFMHETWNNAQNGGLNRLYHNQGQGHFTSVPPQTSRLLETHWSLAIGTADFNRDGLPDLYVANDFGPDDCYLNLGDMRFERLAGKTAGSLGRDSYKGMNVSIGDLDNRGWPDVYVSNVHAPLQAEGSLAWRVEANPSDPFRPTFADRAVARCLVNEKRFGWGAAFGDLDLDGWLDVTQANGMVDDTPDKRFAEPKSYWYQAAQVMRSSPETHSYADRWGDLRGYEIWGHQACRVLLSDGHSPACFADVAERVGLGRKGNARAVALADFDNDGDLDLFLTRQFETGDLFRNTRIEEAATRGRPAHWIGFRLHGDGRSSSRDAFGTQVVLKADPNCPAQSRELSSTSGFSAQSDPRLLFGLGTWQGNVSLEITWPDGRVETHPNLTPGRYHDIHQPALTQTP